MRLIKTFILRLYTDPEQREQICGDLRTLSGHKTIPFKTKTDLLSLLNRLVKKEINGVSMPPSQDEIDPDTA